MEKILNIIFGSSYRTSIAGYLAAIAQALIPVLEKTTPTKQQILTAVFIAILGRFAKSTNVSGKE